MRKGWKIRMAAVLAVLCCAGGARGAAAEPMTLAGFDGVTGRDWARSEFFTRMQARTGVAFAPTQYSDSEAFQHAKEEILRCEGVLPDVLFKAELTPQEELRGAANDALIDLAPLLPEHTPNLWALLDAHPDWRAAITLPDGKIVALPALNEEPEQVILWINRAWLEALQLPMPGSPEALRETLTAFRDGDPNRNGRKDELPLLLTGPWEARWLMPYFGLVANDYNLFLGEDGAVRFAPFEPEFAEFLRYLRGLNAEGLLGEEAFRTTHVMLEQAKDANKQRIGALIAPAPYIPLDVESAEAFAALSPMAYRGKTAYRDLLGPVWRGAFAITRACPDPAAALRWVDQLYAEEGAILAAAGEKDVDYAVDPDGRWTFLIEGGRSAEFIQTQALMLDGGTMPGIRPMAFMARSDHALQNRILTEIAEVSRFARMPMPLVYLTDAEQAEIDALQAAVGRAVEEGVARFTTGETPLDEEHLAAFERSLREAGAEALVAAWQAVLDRK